MNTEIASIADLTGIIAIIIAGLGLSLTAYVVYLQKKTLNITEEMHKVNQRHIEVKIDYDSIEGGSRIKIKAINPSNQQTQVSKPGLITTKDGKKHDLSLYGDQKFMPKYIQPGNVATVAFFENSLENYLVTKGYSGNIELVGYYISHPDEKINKSKSFSLNI